MPAPPHDPTGKFCAFKAHVYDEVEKVIICGRNAAGWDRAAREYRCVAHLNRKPHVKRQMPGSRKVKTSWRPAPTHPWKNDFRGKQEETP